MKINRPLSPHLTIYKPQLTSVLSIFHRISAVLLVLFFIGIVVLYKYTFIYLTIYPYYLSLFFFFFQSYFILFTLTNCALIAIIYHMTNGIRHLLWDFGFFLELRQVYVSGIIMLLTAFVLVCFILFQLYTF